MSPFPAEIASDTRTAPSEKCANRPRVKWRSNAASKFACTTRIARVMPWSAIQRAFARVGKPLSKTPKPRKRHFTSFHQTDDEDSAVGLKLEKAKEDAKLKAIIEKPKAIRVPLPVTKRELKNVASKPINARCFRTQFRVSLAFFLKTGSSERLRVNTPRTRKCSTRPGITL